MPRSRSLRSLLGTPGLAVEHEQTRLAARLRYLSLRSLNSFLGLDPDEQARLISTCVTVPRPGLEPGTKRL